jgi:hypothetical protein
MINKSVISHLALAAHSKQSQAHTNKSNDDHPNAQKSHNKTSEEKLKEAPTSSEKIFNRPTKLELFLKEPTAIEPESIQEAIENRAICPTYPDRSADKPSEINSDQVADKIDQILTNFNEKHAENEVQKQAEREKEEQQKATKVVNDSVTDIQRAVNQGDAVEGATRLRVVLSRLPPEQRTEVLKRLKDDGTLDHLARSITNLDAKGTATAVKELANTVNLVGANHSRLLTDSIAKVMADGGMEQVGDDANGGLGGVFKGANTHNSEREFIDAVAALGNSPEAELFRSSLTQSLVDEAKSSQGERADRANAMAAAVATGDSKLIPDDGLWSRVRNFGQDALNAVNDTVKHFDKLRTDATNKAIESVTQISKAVEQLKPGESVTLSVSGEVSARLDVESGYAVTVTKNEDGTYTVKGSAELLAGIGIKGRSTGGGGAKVGGGGIAEFTFDNSADASQAAKTLFKMMSPIGMPSDEESKLLSDNLSAIEFGINNSVSGKLGGFSAEIDASMMRGRIEFENGKPVALTLSSSLSVSGSVKSEFYSKLGLPSGFTGNLSGTLAQRFSLESLPEGNILDQIQAIKNDPMGYVGNTDRSMELSFTVNGKVEGMVGPGIEITGSIKGIKASNLKAVLQRFSEGDIEGAVAATEGQATIKVTNYTDLTMSFGLDLGVAKLEASESIHSIDEKHEYVIKPSDDGENLTYKKVA